MKDPASENPLDNVSKVFRWVLEDLPSLSYKGKTVQSRIGASPRHFLPAWFVEADRIWRDVVRVPIGVKLIEQPAAPLGAIVSEMPQLQASFLLFTLIQIANSMEHQSSGRLIIDPLVERYEARRASYLQAGLVPPVRSLPAASVAEPRCRRRAVGGRCGRACHPGAEGNALGGCGRSLH
jgi:hypothetical protein